MHPIRNRHLKALSPPKVGGGTAKHGNTAPLAIVAHLHIILHTFQIGFVRLISFAQQITQGQSIALDRPFLGIDMEIDTEDRMIMILKFNRLLDIEFTKH